MRQQLVEERKLRRNAEAKEATAFLIELPFYWAPVLKICSAR
jgi:hypothetical protein